MMMMMKKVGVLSSESLDNLTDQARAGGRARRDGRGEAARRLGIAGRPDLVICLLFFYTKKERDSYIIFRK